MSSVMPEWFQSLESEDISFIRNFILASGSLKEVAKIYNVSYPTVRLRLDKVIQKIKIHEVSENDTYILLIKKMALEEKIDVETAKLLINAYKEKKKE